MAEPHHRDGAVTDTTTDRGAAGDAAQSAPRRRVRRPAGPPAGGATADVTVPTTARRAAAVPRKTAPIGNLRRGPAPARTATTTGTATPAATETPTATTTPAATESGDSPEASADRSGQTLGYRQRRRAHGDVAPRATRRPVDRSRLGLILAAGVSAVVIVALAVASVLFAMSTSRIDDAASQRAAYSAFARQMIVNLTSLSPTTIDTAVDTFQNDTSGKALQQLQQTMQQTEDLIRSQNVTTKGTILSDAVVDSDADSATVMLVSGWTMKNPGTTAPNTAPAGATPTPPTDDTVVQTFRWKVQITKINGAMKLTDIEWVT